jgi:uncharacterized membrane protein
MPKERLTAFSDGVIAIIITIMVLEMKPPHHPDLASLAALAPVFFSYVLSFVYLAIYWNNHHHLLMMADRVDGAILWANMHLLFWLSLVPFCTGWMGENRFASLTVTVYGFNLLMAGVAYYIVQIAIIHHHGRDGALAKALGDDVKGKLSPLAYVVAIIASFFSSAAALAVFALVALVWLIPDRRIERAIANSKISG